MPTTKVLIIGGGIGGLALAHGLKQHKVPFHVFEKDRTESYRAQGYRIRIGGPVVTALQYLLDVETHGAFELSCADLRTTAIPEIDAETARVDEPNIGAAAAATEPLNSSDSERPKAYCVDRTAFREILIKRLGAENITYDKSFSRYEETSSGITAYFADGSTAEGGLLIGADGRFSRVRQQFLPELDIQDTGMRCLYGKTPLTLDLRAAGLHPDAGKRMSFVKDRSRPEILVMGFEPISFPHRDELKSLDYNVPPDYLFWALSCAPRPLGLDPATTHVDLSPEDSEKRALEVSEHWDPSLRTIITHQAAGSTSAFSITCAASDFGNQTWEPNAKVTLLGDAVHPMAPTGSGAVMALTDARALCQMLVTEGQSRDAIGRYEDGMRKEASKAIPTSLGMIRMMASMTKENEKHLGEMALQIRKANMEKKER